MTSIFISPEIFKLMHARTDDWIKEGLPGCDIPMIPLVKDIQNFPGLTTIWCCEGHVKVKPWDSFYMMLAVTPEGFDHLQKIFLNLMGKLLDQADAKNLDAIRPNNLTMSFTQRITPVAERDYWSPVVNLGISLRNEKQKETFFKLFNEALMEEILAFDLKGDVLNSLVAQDMELDRNPSLDFPVYDKQTMSAGQSQLPVNLYGNGESSVALYPGTISIWDFTKDNATKEFDVTLPSSDATVTLTTPSEAEITKLTETADFLKGTDVKVITDPKDLVTGKHYFIQPKAPGKEGKLALAECIVYIRGCHEVSKALRDLRGSDPIVPPFQEEEGTMKDFFIAGPVDMGGDLGIVADRAEQAVALFAALT